jgi:hypothetical protein
VTTLSSTRAKRSWIHRLSSQSADSHKYRSADQISAATSVLRSKTDRKWIISAPHECADFISVIQFQPFTQKSWSRFRVILRHPRSKSPAFIILGVTTIDQSHEVFVKAALEFSSHFSHSSVSGRGFLHSHPASRRAYTDARSKPRREIGALKSRTVMQWRTEPPIRGRSARLLKDRVNSAVERGRGDSSTKRGISRRR